MGTNFGKNKSNFTIFFMVNRLHCCLYRTEQCLCITIKLDSLWEMSHKENTLMCKVCFIGPCSCSTFAVSFSTPAMDHSCTGLTTPVRAGVNAGPTELEHPSFLVTIGKLLGMVTQSPEALCLSCLCIRLGATAKPKKDQAWRESPCNANYSRKQLSFMNQLKLTC